jgi:hypothetical protein
MSKKKKYKKSGIAPLVEVDRNELGDKRLDPAENVFRQREKALSEASQFKMADQGEMEDPSRQCGPRISHHTLLARLQKLAPQLTAKDSANNNLALYFPRNTDELDEAIREGAGLDSNDPVFFMSNKYVGGFPKEEIPEYSYVDIDTSKIATREHMRSWRSVLIGLLKAGVISYAQTVQAFGDPANDQRSKRWFRETLEWRTAPDKAFTRRQIL